MDLCKEILIKLLENEEITVHFSNTGLNFEKIVSTHIYQALEQIKQVIQEECYDDKECFQRVEEIICILESVGSHGGNRHDF